MKLFEVIDDQIIRDEFTTAEEWFEQLDDFEEDDLHFNNVMIRRTSVGPQLVIIDPVA